MLRRNCLLLFLCFLFEQSSCAPFQSRPGQEWPHSQTGPSAAGRNGGSRGFQRVKRGWVWNQFFVLEEYMGSDPQYVGKVQSALIKNMKNDCISTATLVNNHNSFQKSYSAEPKPVPSAMGSVCLSFNLFNPNPQLIFVCLN